MSGRQTSMIPKLPVRLFPFDEQTQRISVSLHLYFIVETGVRALHVQTLRRTNEMMIFCNAWDGLTNPLVFDLNTASLYIQALGDPDGEIHSFIMGDRAGVRVTPLEEGAVRLEKLKGFQIEPHSEPVYLTVNEKALHLQQVSEVLEFLKAASVNPEYEEVQS